MRLNSEKCKEMIIDFSRNYSLTSGIQSVTICEQVLVWGVPLTLHQEVGQVCLVGVDTVEMDMLQIRCQICSCEVWGGSYFWKGGSQKGGFGRTPPGYGPGV